MRPKEFLVMLSDAIAARVGATPVEYPTYDYAENENGAKALSDKGVVTF